LGGAIAGFSILASGSLSPAIWRMKLFKATSLSFFFLFLLRFRFCLRSAADYESQVDSLSLVR